MKLWARVNNKVKLLLLLKLPPSLLYANSRDVNQLISATTVGIKRHLLLHIHLVEAFLFHLSHKTIKITNFSSFMTTLISHPSIKCSKWNSTIFCNLSRQLPTGHNICAYIFITKTYVWFLITHLSKLSLTICLLTGYKMYPGPEFSSTILTGRVTNLTNFSICSLKSHWHNIIIIQHIYCFLCVVCFFKPNWTILYPC
jgi:hypothetical protein